MLKFVLRTAAHLFVPSSTQRQKSDEYALTAKLIEVSFDGLFIDVCKKMFLRIINDIIMTANNFTWSK